MTLIAGADDWVGIERYGVLKLAWLKGILVYWLIALLRTQNTRYQSS